MKLTKLNDSASTGKKKGEIITCREKELAAENSDYEALTAKTSPLNMNAQT